MNGKYYFINKQGEIALKGPWENVGDFDKASFTNAKRGGKYGVIDTEGNLLVPCEWDLVYIDSYNGRSVVVLKDKKFAIVDLTGKVLIEPQLESYPLWRSIGDGGVYSCEEDAASENARVSQYRLINYRGQTIGGEDAQWDNWVVISDRLIAAEKDEQWQVMDLVGNPVDGSVWDQVEYDALREGLPKERIYVKKNGKFGYLDAEGKAILEPYWSDAQAFGEGGLACVQDPKSGLYGYIDQSGEYVLKPKWNGGLSFAGGSAFVKEGKLWGCINAEGEYLVEPKWHEVVDLKPGLNCFKVVLDRDVGVVDEKGEYIIEPKWDDVEISMVLKDKVESFVVRKDRKAGVVDSRGIVLVKPRWDDLEAILENRYWMVQQEKQWGVFDAETDTVVCEPRWKDAFFIESRIVSPDSSILEKQPFDFLLSVKEGTDTIKDGSVYCNGYGEIVWEEVVHNPRS